MTVIGRIFYVDETMAVPGGFTPVILYRDDPSMYPMTGNGRCARPWVWGPSLEEAKAEAAKVNEECGYTPEMQREILASVWAACPHGNRPTNCDGEDCTRRDCELHYMDAPVRLSADASGAWHLGDTIPLDFGANDPTLAALADSLRDGDE